MDFIAWIERGLKKPGKTRTELARRLGGVPSIVTQLTKGERRLKVDEVAIIAEYLEEPPPPLACSRFVPILGEVLAEPQAGTLKLWDQSTHQEIAVPYGAEASIAAFTVRGRGMPGLGKEGWIVFCGERQEPPASDQVGELCRCGLGDGSSVVRFLEESLYDGRFDLTGYGEEPLRAQKVLWAETVLHIATARGARALVRKDGSAQG